VKIGRVTGNEPLAFGQGSDVIDRDRRPLVPVTTLSAFEQDRASGTEQQKGGPSIWPAHQYRNARWAMAIDLSKCNGCGKCVIGCQAENTFGRRPAGHARRARDVVDAHRPLLRRAQEGRPLGR